MVSFALASVINLDVFLAAPSASAEVHAAAGDFSVAAPECPSLAASFSKLIQAAISEVPEWNQGDGERGEEEREPDPQRPAAEPPAWLHLLAMPVNEPVLPYALAPPGEPTTDGSEHEGMDPAEGPGAWLQERPQAAAVCTELPAPWPTAAENGPSQAADPVSSTQSLDQHAVPADQGDPLPASEPPDFSSPHKSPATGSVPAESTAVDHAEPAARLAPRTVLAATLHIRRDGPVERPQKTTEKPLQDAQQSADVFGVSATPNRTESTDLIPQANVATEMPVAAEEDVRPSAVWPTKQTHRPQWPAAWESRTVADGGSSQTQPDGREEPAQSPEHVKAPDTERALASSVSEKQPEHRQQQGPEKAVADTDHVRPPASLTEHPHAPSDVAGTVVRGEVRRDAAPHREPAQPSAAAAVDAAAHVKADTHEVRPTQRAETISIRVQGADREAVEIRLQERRGEVRLSLRASAPETVERIRETLPELSHRLQAEGYDAKGWRPDEIAAAQPAAPESNQDSRRHHHEQHQQQEPEQRKRPFLRDEDSESFAQLFGTEGERK